MQLTQQAAEARRAYFLGPKATSRHVALFEQWDTAKAEKRGVWGEASGDDLEINVLDVIGYDWWTGGGITAKAFKRVLDEYPKARQIRVVINSPGGIIDDGVGIYNALKRHSARIVTECIGMAASSASVIYQAGDEREMNIGTQVMIHRAMSCTCGHADDFDAAAKMLRAYDSSILDIYAERAMKGDRDGIKQLVDAETYMSASEAVDLGFADTVLTREARSGAKRTDEPAEPPDPMNRKPITAARARHVTPMAQLATRR